MKGFPRECGSGRKSLQKGKPHAFYRDRYRTSDYPHINSLVRVWAQKSQNHEPTISIRASRPHLTSPYHSSVLSIPLPVFSIFILYEGGTYTAWADNNGIYYYTTSSDGMNWNVGLEIVHTHNGGDLFYTNGSLSVVKKSDRAYEMWYSSSLNGFSDLRPRCNKGISYAESSDGITWDLIDDIPCMERTNAILKTTDGVA